jgi:hypothetical protein
MKKVRKEKSEKRREEKEWRGEEWVWICSGFLKIDVFLEKCYF